MRLLDQRNLSFVDSSYLLVCAFFIASKPMMKLFIKEDNQLPQMSIDPMVLWSISTFSKIKDRITCLLFSPQCDDVKKNPCNLIMYSCYV